MVQEDFDRRYRQQAANKGPSKTRPMGEIMRAIAATIGQGGKRASYEQNRGGGLGSGTTDMAGITADLVAKNSSMPRAQQAAMGTRQPSDDPTGQAAMQSMMMGEDSYETEAHGEVVNQMNPEDGVSGVERVAYEDGYIAGRCVRPDWGCGDLDNSEGQWLEL